MKYAANATITRVEVFTGDLRQFTIRPDSGAIPDFLPGQYAELAIPPAEPLDPDGNPVRVHRRAYSIASPPSLRDAFQFLIVLVEDGIFTPRLFAMKEGDRLWLGDKIKGHFTLDEIDGGPGGKTLVMFSTGTGIAPFMSMWKEHRGDRPWSRYVMIHGVRYARDLAYRGELEAAAKEDPSFVYIPVVSREEFPGVHGRVNLLLEGGLFERLAGEPLLPENCHVFLCGNPEMIDQVTATLKTRGFKQHVKKDPGNIHFERYW